MIGIALEKGADERREAEAISKFCSSMQITYRQLMGRAPDQRSPGGTFDASKHFRVTQFPTLMLVHLGEQVLDVLILRR